MKILRHKTPKVKQNFAQKPPLLDPLLATVARVTACILCHSNEVDQHGSLAAWHIPHGDEKPGVYKLCKPCAVRLAFDQNNTLKQIDQKIEELRAIKRGQAQ